MATPAQFQLKMTQDQAIDGLRNAYGNELTSADIKAFCAMNDIGYPTVCKKIKQFKVSKGRWNLTVKEKKENLEATFAAPAVVPDAERSLVPDNDSTFVKFGPFPDIKKIIQSNQFYPTFITGLSGNGKTFSVEQACAQLGRELILSLIHI